MMKNESGRSMVEMLGVLAIIGVLSVGGIAGYTMAMNKYKANEIAAVASQCAMSAMAKATTTNADVGATNNYVDCSTTFSLSDSNATLTVYSPAGGASATVKATITSEGVRTAYNNIITSKNGITMEAATS